MAIFYNPRTITDGLVLCLDAANSKSYPGSGTTWTDLSGNGNNGTLVNGVGYNGSNLGSLSFDGVNDFISTTNNVDFSFGTGNFSIECWGYKNGSQTDFASFVSTGTASAITNWQLCFGGSSVSPSSVNIIAFFIGGQETLYLYDNLVLPDQQWFYFTVTRNGTNVSLYKNATLISTGTNSSNLTDQTLKIGINRASSSRLKGNISSVRLYKGKALTASEIQQNFNATRSRYGI